MSATALILPIGKVKAWPQARALTGNAKGITTLVVLVSLGGLSISLFLIGNWIVSLKQQVIKTENMLNVRFAMNSTTDFALYAIKQKYCLSSTFLQDANCDLNHPASIERLLMSNEQANYIQEMIKNGVITNVADPTNLQIDSIEKTIPFSAISSTHPLYVVFEDAKLKTVASGIWIKVERNNNLFIPRSGREVFLKLTVELVDMKGNHPLTFGPKKAQVISNLTAYPRELGTFALIVAGSMHLDLPYNATVPKGDMTFHQFASSSGFKGGPGLTFLSPVYVNKDIHLPTPPGGPSKRTMASSVYTPVTFAEKVYMGNGSVYENNLLYKPATAGATPDRMWANNKLFGGFQKGLETDGSLDAGLLVFSGVSTGAKPDTTLMNACIQRMKQKTDNSYINTTALSSALSQNGVNDFSYRFGLTGGNEFLPQENTLLPINTANWGTGTATRNSTKTKGAVGNLTLFVGSRSVTGQLPIDGSLVLVPEVGSAAYKAKLEKNIQDIEASILTSQNTLADLTNQIALTKANLAQAKADLLTEQTNLIPLQNNSTQLEADLQKAKDDLKLNQDNLALENAKPTPDPLIVADLQGKIDVLQNTTLPDLNTKVTAAKVQLDDGNKKIADLNLMIADLENKLASFNQTTLETMIADAQTNLVVAKAVLASYLNKVANPPEITITVTSVLEGASVSTTKVLTKIVAKNVSSLLDENGNPTAPAVNFEAYDLTYVNSELVKPPGNPGTRGYVNFTLANNNTELSAPASLADAPFNGNPTTTTEDTVDYTSLDKQCAEHRNASSTQGFGGANWDVSFTEATRHSWNFAGTETSQPGDDPMIEQFLLNNQNADPIEGGFKTASKLHIVSIAKECVIKGNTGGWENGANLVVGLLVCDKLTILKRDRPLRIIGTVIANQVEIDPTAYQMGITWSSIYHPQATSILRANTVLKSLSGRPCDTLPGPIWHPDPSILDASDRFSCNAISLRSLADPFQWTTMDPDCGLLPGASATTCKRKVVRFLMVEQSREDFL